MGGGHGRGPVGGTMGGGLRALGTQLSAPPQVRAHGPQLLTAVIGGLDDRDDPHSLVALEAMVGLARLLDLAEPQDLRPVLLHVAIRIRPFFDSVGWPGHGGTERPDRTPSPSLKPRLYPAPWAPEALHHPCPPAPRRPSGVRGWGPCLELPPAPSWHRPSLVRALSFPPQVPVPGRAGAHDTGTRRVA